MKRNHFDSTSRDQNQALLTEEDKQKWPNRQIPNETNEREDDLTDAISSFNRETEEEKRIRNVFLFIFFSLSLRLRKQ